MKLSELKPCSSCGGPLRKPPLIQWYVLRVTTAILKARAVNQVLGLNMMFGGNALGLAEAMAPESDAVALLGDLPDSGGWIELHLCFDCVHLKVLSLGHLLELRKPDEEAEACESIPSAPTTA